MKANQNYLHASMKMLEGSSMSNSNGELKFAPVSDSDEVCHLTIFVFTGISKAVMHIALQLR